MKIIKETPPEEGDIVLITVTRVEPHAAFIKLEEYENVEGLIHISEISKSWVKNIKTHFRDKQKIVCKIVEVKKPNFVHASIRRVSDYDKRAKWDQIKRNRRIENIIDIIARKSKKKPEAVYAMLKPLEKQYGEIYFAFEEAKKQGKNFFGKLPIKDIIWEVVDKSISLPVVDVIGMLRIQSTASDGVKKIKSMLAGVDADISYLGAPNYRISVKGNDYKEAEKKMTKLIESIQKKASKTESVIFENNKKK